jgi:DNA-binding NarL/FixJ family response regulator
LERTRILLVDLPRLLREIVLGSVVDEADLEVVDHVSRVEVLEDAARRHDVDVVVIGSDDPELALRLLDLRPRLKVLAVGGEGLDTRLYELRPWRVLLGDVSPRTLVEAIRAAAGATWSATAWSGP